MAVLLELVNNVLLETGYQTLSTVVDNDAVNARKILGLAQREGRALSKKDWKILVKRNVITTASSAQAYALPTDFDRFIDNTHWNETDSTSLDGPVTTQRWQANDSGIVTVGINDRWQVRADANSNRFYVDPLPTSAENLTFYYATNTWCRSHGGVRQVKWLHDNDVLLLDDFVYELGLKVRWLDANQRPCDYERAEYVRERDKAFARDGGLPTLFISGPREFKPMANTGESNFG